MAFTATELVQIRKYCGYPLFGNTPIANFQWRYSTEYGDLEFYLQNMSPEEQSEVTTYYLPNLILLEQDIPSTRQNSDTARAAVWYRNPRELQERIQNYTILRKQLCDFMGVLYGPALANEGGLRIVP